MSEMHKVFGSLLFAAFVLFGVGCASGPEETSTSRTTEDVRGDSDRFFQKMEKEEKKE